MSNQVLFSNIRTKMRCARDERGFVLITTMVVMVMLVLLGLASTTSTVRELQIASNDREYKRNFYRAEGAAMESAQRLDNEDDTEELRPSLTNKVWLQSGVDYTDPANWTENAGTPTNYQTAALDDAASDVRIAALGLGVVRGNKGGSVDMTASSVKAFQLFGRSAERNGLVMIEMGYKKRF